MQTTNQYFDDLNRICMSCLLTTAAGFARRQYTMKKNYGRKNCSYYAFENVDITVKYSSFTVFNKNYE